MAHDWPNFLLYAFFTDRPDPEGNQANQGTEAQSSVSGHALEEPALVRRAVSAAHCSPMDHSPETRPPLSGERNDLAPPARTMGTTSLASRWEFLDLPESVLNTISQARAPGFLRGLGGSIRPPCHLLNMGSAHSVEVSEKPSF